MRKLMVLLWGISFLCACDQEENYLSITENEYIDRMKAAWIGQMAGVGLGAPTEFDFNGTIIPMSEMPVWKPELVNQFGQDDLYVEMTFLGSLERYGMDVDIRQAGIDFANTGYFLWAANNRGRENLREGIAPPESGHPIVNKNADDIDYQIEADYSGIIAPGMLQVPVDLGEKFGRLMNYGDGVYAGQFIGGMYAAAFFEKEPEKIVEAGLSCIPPQSQYAECIRDVLTWFREDPVDWQATWRKIEKKYYQNPEYQKLAAASEKAWPDINVKINGAYVVTGLLYGKGNADSTMVIATRCGRDSDCNPSSAAGILFTTIGFDRIPEKFKIALETDKDFSYTRYDFDELIRVCTKLARENIEDSGGKIVNKDGEVSYLIPLKPPTPSPYVQSWEPGPFDPENRFSEDEMDQIGVYPVLAYDSLMDVCAPGWKVYFSGKLTPPGISAIAGRKNVLTTSAMSPGRGVNLIYEPDGMKKHKTLMIEAGAAPGKPWKLLIRINWETVQENIIGDEGAFWEKTEVDLSRYEEKEPAIHLIVEQIDDRIVPNYWSKIMFE